MLLWRGHCSVHGRFTLDCVQGARRRVPGVHTSWFTPSADTTWSRRPTTSARRSTSSHHRGRPPPAPPGRSVPAELVRRLATSTRQRDHVPRPYRLLPLDDEPHRSTAPGLGVEELVAGRGSTGSRSIRHRAVRAPGARPMLALP
jgi:hypothetical protein